MRKRVEVIYENGVLRPVGPMPADFKENQRLTITIESRGLPAGWLAAADPTVSLEAVRQALAKIPGTLAEAVAAEREER